MGDDGWSVDRPTPRVECKPTERRNQPKSATLEAVRRHPSLGRYRGGMGSQSRSMIVQRIVRRTGSGQAFRSLPLTGRVERCGCVQLVRTDRREYPERLYHGPTRSPQIPALPGLIVGLQDPDKICHAGSILVFGRSRNLRQGRGGWLPEPHQKIGDVSHGLLSAPTMAVSIN